MARRIQIFIFIIFHVCLVFGQDTYTITPTEYQIKAAFLYKFAKFVQWPEEAFINNPKEIVIGILGQDPFGEDLNRTVQGKTIHGREIVVRRSHHLEKMQDCQILFISDSEEMHFSRIFSHLHTANVLTIGDTEGFCEKGGIINFIRKENKIHFEINISAAKAAGLKLSSKLLNLAKIVENSS